MPYKIAVASSDGTNVDLHFGAADSFLIYDVSDEGTFSLAEKRDYNPADEAEASCTEKAAGCADKGCAGSGGGCSHGTELSEKVLLIADCRCVVCEKIGFHVTKQLEKKAVAAFDVDCTVQEALEKITKYFHSVDNHVSLARR